MRKVDIPSWIFQIPSNTPYNRTYKICLIGDSGVGKSMFLNILLGTDIYKYRPTYASTIGNDKKILGFHLGGKNIVVEFWDCSGRSWYRDLSDGYYIGSDAVLIFFSTKDSFRSVTKLESDINRVCGNIVIRRVNMSDNSSLGIKNKPNNRSNKFIPSWDWNQSRFSEFILSVISQLNRKKKKRTIFQSSSSSLSLQI